MAQPIPAQEYQGPRDATYSPPPVYNTAPAQGGGYPFDPATQQNQPYAYAQSPGYNGSPAPAPGGQEIGHVPNALDTPHEKGAVVSPPLPTHQSHASMGPPPAQRQGQVGVTPLNQLGGFPAQVDCTVCRQVTKTRIHKKAGDRAYLWGAVVCLICCCLAWVPCVMDDLKDTEHYCERCNSLLAVSEAGGAVKVMNPQPVASQYGNKNESMNYQANAVNSPPPTH